MIANVLSLREVKVGGDHYGLISMKICQQHFAEMSITHFMSVLRFGQKLTNLTIGPKMMVLRQFRWKTRLMIRFCSSRDIVDTISIEKNTKIQKKNFMIFLDF